VPVAAGSGSEAARGVFSVAGPGRFWSNAHQGWLHRLGKVGVAVQARSLAVALALALALVASRADALSITGLVIAKGGTNTADGTTTSGQNFSQTTSSVSTTLSPTTVPDTLGSFSEFITRYAMIAAADRQMTTGNFTLNMVSSYSITFTVNNPTGATVKIDINTLRSAALTSVHDSTGSSTITLGAVAGQVNAVTQPGLALAAAGGTASSSAINTSVNQSSTGYTITTNAIATAFVLQFNFSSSVVSAQDGGAIRMGTAGSLPMTADDYPGAGSRTAANDGHFVDVKATIIAAAPEPNTGGLVALGLLAIAMRSHARGRNRSRSR
jgi:hypothetical protein